jgi:uncharacterized protein (DUF488 family)
MLDSSGVRLNDIRTIGYEGTDIDSFMRRLIDEGVEVLLDIRDLPLSRKKGFSKNSIASTVAMAGIEYRHVKALGDPKPGRQAAREGRISDFRDIFGRHLASAEAHQALHSIGAEWASRQFCLMCFERHHEHCHRSMVAQRLVEMFGGQIVHLKV